MSKTLKTYDSMLKIIYELEQQNKRYREAIDYVMETETRHYSNMQELLGDIKFVINKTLEES